MFLLLEKPFDVLDLRLRELLDVSLPMLEKYSKYENVKRMEYKNCYLLFIVL